MKKKNELNLEFYECKKKVLLFHLLPFFYRQNNIFYFISIIVDFEVNKNIIKYLTKKNVNKNGGKKF